MSHQLSDGARPVGERLSELGDYGGHRTLAEKAFGMLHEAILVGALQPGERLPIGDLAEAMNLSPMPIREALRRLDAAGLVEHIPHRGARVAGLTIEDLIEVYDARLMLELPAIAGAAENFTSEDEQAAAVSLERLEEATSSGEKIKALNAHTAFHLGLYRASSLHWLPRLISPLWDNAERYRVASLGGNLGLFENRASEHRDLLKACSERDAKLASALLWNHLARTANAIVEEMGGKAPYKLRRVPGRA